MSRINTNIQSLLATRILNRNNTSLNTALERISTGLRINSGKDDPAGLIASEALRASKVAITAAINNARRADNIVAVIEGGLQEVSRLLLELEDLVTRSANEAGLSPNEVSANQLQIDTILQSLNRIADTTEFSGRKLLNGNLDFTVSGTTSSNMNISAIQINAAKIPEGSSRTVTVQIAAASEFALVSATGAGTGGSLSAATSLQIRGNFGTDVLSFASGTTMTQMAAAVNASTQLTGVSAVVSGSMIQFTSTTFGSNALVSVELLSTTGTFNTNGNTSGAEDYGVDGSVTVNGSKATVDGLNLAVRSGTMSANLVMAENFARMTSGTATSTSFEITGGGALFALSPTLGLVGQETLGVTAVSTGSLGDGTVGFLSTLGSGQDNDLHSKNFASAQRVIRRAIDQVSSLRGRLGAFQKDVLAPTINSLQVTFENTAAAESAIRDADFAVETSNLTRAQILVQSATAALQLANASPQNVLALLG